MKKKPVKVLLIYPQYTHSSEFDSRAPSMSLVYLASTLERCGHEVLIYDASLGPIVKMGRVFRYGVSDKEVGDFLSSHRFDIVGITCSFTARWRFVSRIAQQVKEIFPDVPVAVGGLFPTSRWEYCLNHILKSLPQNLQVLSSRLRTTGLYASTCGFH